MFFVQHITLFICLNPYATHMEPTWNPHGDPYGTHMAHPAQTEKQPERETPQTRVLNEKRTNGEIDYRVILTHHRHHLIIMPRVKT